MILQVQNLHKQFGGVRAVRGVDLALADKQIHAVIGPNGAGKSTLLAQLAGEIAPDRGRIVFAGRDITGLAAHKRAQLGLARCFQTADVIAPMTLLENATLALLAAAGNSFNCWSPLARDADLRARAMQLLEEVGLAHDAELRAGEAAHGVRRQLEIAMALAPRPKLLLLDEPMAGLGKSESAAMIALLKKRKGSAAMLLIEHDMDAVFALADTASVLVDGRIIAAGSTAEIRGNAEVQRAYLGTPQ
ncbi:MAG: ABC transporter ATP-binding protein [Gammaproteobacteria bacterium]|nr:ABC transporter ATP-binding protein [Gammaproteobacteria bacterium]MDA8011744.1 ABC transporter ATP-binding protein [Gammaproteobacteria bacterium]MDA8014343.1 ABC transporter ATP-binding protein [Gammaproteobacteria bacterium]